MPQKILILGIGNVLYADEGIGVHFVNYLQQKYRFHGEPQLEYMDGGTLANALIPLLVPYDHLIVVDTVTSHGADVGNVYFFDFDKVPAEIDFQGSAHEVEMLQTLNMMEMLCDRPKTYLLGVIPQVLEAMSFELSPKVQAAVPTMESAILRHLASLGFQAEQVSSPDIVQVANRACEFES